MSKHLLGGIVGCKDKISSWNLIGFSIMVVALGQQYHYVGEKPTVSYYCILIAMQGHQIEQNEDKRHDEPGLQLNLLHWV